MRDYGLAHVVLPSYKARLQSYRASVGQNTACLVVGHRGAGFMYAVRQRERVVPRRYPIFLGLDSTVLADYLSSPTGRQRARLQQSRLQKKRVRASTQNAGTQPQPTDGVKSAPPFY